MPADNRVFRIIITLPIVYCQLIWSLNKYLKGLFQAKGYEQITSHSCNMIHVWLLILYFVPGKINGRL